MGGQIRIHASKHTILEGQCVAVSMPALPLSKEDALHDRRFVFKDDEGNPYVNQQYIIYDKDGTKYTGVTDENGQTQVVQSKEPKDLTAHLLKDI